MKYANYEYYSNEYNGNLEATLFSSLIKEASMIIKNNVNVKLNEEDITDEIKFATCKVVDYLNKYNKVDTSVQSISVDGVSKTYKADSNNEKKQELANILSYLPQDLTRYI